MPRNASARRNAGSWNAKLKSTTSVMVSPSWPSLRGMSLRRRERAGAQVDRAGEALLVLAPEDRAPGGRRRAWRSAPRRFGGSRSSTLWKIAPGCAARPCSRMFAAAMISSASSGSIGCAAAPTQGESASNTSAARTAPPADQSDHCSLLLRNPTRHWSHRRCEAVYHVAGGRAKSRAVATTDPRAGAHAGYSAGSACPPGRPHSMTALHDLTAAELLERYRDRSLSPVEVTRAVLERIAAWEPHLQRDLRARWRRRAPPARVSEARWLRHVAAGENVGALEGVPAMVKENIATARHTGAARHRCDRARSGAARRAAGGAPARSGRGDPRQDDDARLRDAVVGTVELPRPHAQPVGPEQEPGRQQLGRGRRRRPRATGRCTSAPTSAARCACRPAGAASSR